MANSLHSVQASNIIIFISLIILSSLLKEVKINKSWCAQHVEESPLLNFFSFQIKKICSDTADIYLYIVSLCSCFVAVVSTKYPVIEFSWWWLPWGIIIIFFYIYIQPKINFIFYETTFSLHYLLVNCIKNK